MKNKENIKYINKLSISYIMLKGLNGQSLEKENPFLTYLMYNMLLSDNVKKSTNNDELNNIIFLIDVEDGVEKKISVIPNVLFHLMIEEVYNLYQKLDDIKSFIDPIMGEQIGEYLDDKDDFIIDLINNYKSSLVFILLNYNSNKDSYNNIKINILKEELKNVVEIEDYDKAIIYRDKIKDTEERILSIKKGDD